MNNTKLYLDDNGILFYTQKLKTLLDEEFAGKADVGDITYLNGLITALQSSLSTETSTRQSADTTLQGNIDTLSGTVNTLSSNTYRKTDVYTKNETDTAISTAIAGVVQIRYEIVQSLPQVGENGVIYLVQYAQTPQGNVYQEWIWLPSSQTYETLGSTNQIDLSNYLQKTDIAALTNQEIDDIFESVFDPTVDGNNE